jgi:hypothetical protein
MKHAWVWALAIAAGCSSSGGGEPQMGDATIQYGTTPKMMATGSVIMDTKTAGNMRIQLGTDNVTCSTDLDANEPPGGTYVYFSIPQTGTTSAQVSVTLFDISGRNISINITSGSVMLTSPADGRVAGTLAFSTTDDKVGTITMTGAFDVKKCF